MSSIRKHLRRSNAVAWVSLLALAATQVALFVEIGGREHGYCSEHKGAVHHLDAHSDTAAKRNEAPIALNAPQPKKSVIDNHDHCDALGTGLRPLVKPVKACTPYPFERQTPKKQLELKAKPVSTEPIYAFAPKASPPRV